jgi:hypothetical protein
VRDPCDALDIDLDQATHQLLIHLMEVVHVQIRQPVVALDGVLSDSTSATSPSKSLPEARALRRRRRTKVRDGTKGGLTRRGREAGRQGQHPRADTGEGRSGGRRGWWAFGAGAEEVRSARCACVSAINPNCGFW